MEGLLNGRGDLKDNIRMLKGEGAKYIGRALCLWGAERDFTNSVERARREIPLVLTADPEMVLEACVFEIVGQRVSQIPIPDWVFAAFGQPATNRNFIYENMIYPANMRRSMGQGQVPDESRLETRMWFYYQAVSYIDIGCEAIHFGQVEIMNRNDKDNAHWEELLTSPNEKLYVWGYDEITWFAHQTREYRAKWLQYAWDWLRETDTNAHLQMPGSRTATSSDTR
jgi:hypothetical protein